MNTLKLLRELALALPDTTEQPHFEKTSFRLKKKIFATYDEPKNQLCVKLSEMDQSIFSAFDRTIIFPVPNKWGKQGWTLVDLNRASEEMVREILHTAYNQVGSKGKK
jgi:predicted DNA-binding protein (MmcQ/YjbR family)